MRTARISTLLAAVVLVAAALAGTGCKRRKGDVLPARVPSPTGGAAVVDPDAGDALVEDARRYAVRSWPFAADRVDIRIEDAAMTTDLDAVLERTGAELVVNGGFFDPAGKPLGLAMSEGVVLSRLAKAMSGGVVTWDGERARLWEAESFAMPEHVRFAVQCKPRLVVDGAPNVRSDDGQRSERTALCLRDGGRAIDVFIVRGEAGEATGPSLFALGRYLASRGCEGALNLDGGPSTGVAWREDGGVHGLAPRRGVRHAVVFKRQGP